jgi:deoxyribodipyrimidine photo-lyase
LRLHDNPALIAARNFSSRILPIYIYDDERPGAPGGAQQWWLHHSLTSLVVSIKSRGGRLILRCGDYERMLLTLVKEQQPAAVFWNRCYEPHAIKRDKKIKKTLESQGVEAHSFNGSLLNEPWLIHNQQGNFFKVFTPYWRAAQKVYQDQVPLPLVDKFSTPTKIDSDKLSDWDLLPTKPSWATEFDTIWTPGEQGASRRLNAFLKHDLADYLKRDFPALNVTSRLSPHLHSGELSPKQVVHAVKQHALHEKVSEKALTTFLSEVGWREFSYYLLYHFPSLPKKNFRPEFDKFTWQRSPSMLKKWQQGQTGYPIVDAGMRQLWLTGTMHNRVRMIVASFLIKDLLIDWRKGADWFWDTLVDADLASNSASWQWVAGSGADASPYFRVFNPVLQGVKFDAKGEYVRQWLPVLKNLPDKYVHEPWQAPEDVLAEAGVVLGENYPKPIVDHKLAREEALSRYKKLKQ